MEEYCKCGKQRRAWSCCDVCARAAAFEEAARVAYDNMMRVGKSLQWSDSARRQRAGIIAAKLREMK
jgi:hypothetical protein